MQQQEEAVRLGALLEYRRSLGVADRARLAQQLILFGRREAAEHRQTGDQGTVDRGHRHPAFEARRIPSAAKASHTRPLLPEDPIAGSR